MYLAKKIELNLALAGRFLFYWSTLYWRVTDYSAVLKDTAPHIKRRSLLWPLVKT